MPTVLHSIGTHLCSILQHHLGRMNCAARQRGWEPEVSFTITKGPADSAVFHVIIDRATLPRALLSPRGRIILHTPKLPTGTFSFPYNIYCNHSPLSSASPSYESQFQACSRDQSVRRYQKLRSRAPERHDRVTDD